MAEYTIKVRRFQPESGEGPYWEQFSVDLDPSLSVLDGLLQAKDREDGSLAVRCSCRAAICGSCGMKINGQSGLGCKTQIGEAQEQANKMKGATGVTAAEASSPIGAQAPEAQDAVRATGQVEAGPGTTAVTTESVAPIIIEPMGNMPVIKDLITDMESTHWAKIRRVTPWLLPHGEPPEREYVVEPEAMIDITQSMACIQCGVCVSACLSLEVDPDFVGPAASAKAYRFVGDPRDAHTEDRLLDLAQDPHGIYDCTHCFACVEVCPKDVAPMNQIMRLRRRATGDYDIKDINNGYGHEKAFTGLIETYGTLHEAQLLPRSFGDGSLIKSQLSPHGIKNLIPATPSAIRGVASGKVSIGKALRHHKLPDQNEIKRIYKEIESKDERLELNLYIVGEAASEDEGATAEGSQES